ncbi:MAG: glycyl-radical enzyme activating protein [Bacteroidales bacterium]|nr:glycyl-radical enzyme activating protein [Bacteroidales bacterium]
MKGLIFNIQKYSLFDGPGIRTTVFMKGCPLNCNWCHNPEGISPKEEKLCGKTIGKFWSADELMKELEKDRVFYEESGGGITFSGGEPLMQFEFVKEMLEICKEKGISPAIDTSGYANKSVFRSLHGLTDMYLYDIKLINPADHLKHTGISNYKILKNLEYLIDTGENVRIRIPLIPGITSTEKNVTDIIGFINNLKKQPETDLLPYHPYRQKKDRVIKNNETNKNQEELTEKTKEKILTKFTKAGLKANILQ